jgi:hypothetical protein
MNRLLKHWRLTGRSEAFSAKVVAYADDFVILSRGHAHTALERLLPSVIRQFAQNGRKGGTHELSPVAAAGTIACSP